MYWLAFPLMLLLFGGFAMDSRGGSEPDVVAAPAGGDVGDFTTLDGTTGIPPHK